MALSLMLYLIIFYKSNVKHCTHVSVEKTLNGINMRNTFVVVNRYFEKKKAKCAAKQRKNCVAHTAYTNNFQSGINPIEFCMFAVYLDGRAAFHKPHNYRIHRRRNVLHRNANADQK